MLYKKVGKTEDASRAFENAMDFARAVELLVQMNYYTKAIDCVDRFNMTIEVVQHLHHLVVEIITNSFDSFPFGQ